ncbi:MAG: methyltransferase domain-containing protein [Pirellulales bacterium]|nr:methyltransferase domain-containing protein [Pirellulales bacterium]
MRRAWANHRVFFQEFRRNFHTTGAVLPSGKKLAQALTRHLHPGADQHATAPARRLLEVGPGTGAVTETIIGQMGQADTLHLVELNEAFVERLHHRFEHEPHFRRVAPRAQVFHCAVEHLPTEPTYDAIVSGLPFNNFEPELVEQLLASMCSLLRPGGTLSFFQYVGVRPARSFVSNARQRARLAGIGRALERALDQHEVQRELVWSNVPPAWVHHMRVESALRS